MPSRDIGIHLGEYTLDVPNVQVMVVGLDGPSVTMRVDTTINTEWPITVTKAELIIDEEILNGGLKQFEGIKKLVNRELTLAIPSRLATGHRRVSLRLYVYDKPHTSNELRVALTST